MSLTRRKGEASVRSAPVCSGPNAMVRHFCFDKPEVSGVVNNAEEIEALRQRFNEVHADCQPSDGSV